jgi:hypothetical protein
LIARRVTTVSDFERDFLGSSYSQAAPAFGLIANNPSAGASRIRDEEFEGQE